MFALPRYTDCDGLMLGGPVPSNSQSVGTVGQRGLSFATVCFISEQT